MSAIVPTKSRQPRTQGLDPEIIRLTLLAQAGEVAAYETLYHKLYPSIYAYCYRMMLDRDDTEDLTADTFVKLWRALPRTAPGTNIIAFSHRIACNACLDVLRRRQRIRWLPWEDQKHDHLLVSTPIDDPEQSAISQETRITVQRVLVRMSYRHRLALMLREYDGLSCTEIGDVMGLSRSAVKSMLFRAREEFRRVHSALDRDAA